MGKIDKIIKGIGMGIGVFWGLVIVMFYLAYTPPKVSRAEAKVVKEYVKEELIARYGDYDYSIKNVKYKTSSTSLADTRHKVGYDVRVKCKDDVDDFHVCISNLDLENLEWQYDSFVVPTERKKVYKFIKDYLNKEYGKNKYNIYITYKYKNDNYENDNYENEIIGYKVDVTTSIYSKEGLQTYSYIVIPDKNDEYRLFESKGFVYDNVFSKKESSYEADELKDADYDDEEFDESYSN